MFVTLKCYELPPFTRARDSSITQKLRSHWVPNHSSKSLPSPLCLHLNLPASEDTVSPAALPSMQLLLSKKNTTRYHVWGRILLVPKCHFQGHPSPTPANSFSNTQSIRLCPYRLTFHSTIPFRKDVHSWLRVFLSEPLF